MPRPLAFGNGHVLFLADRFGVIRDLFFGDPLPQNHLTDGKVAMGVFADGRLSWIDDGTWEIDLNRRGDSVGLRLIRDKVELTVDDRLSERGFRREIEVRRAPAGARLYVTSHFNIEESDIGNTCLWSPGESGIVHFKGANRFLVRLEPPAEEYACGHIGFGGYDGTLRDAEDGHLSGNAIAQGSVDATQGRAIAAGDRVVLDILTPLASEGETGMGSDHEAYVRTHCWANGAVMASGDSEIMETNRANYAYCWMRDGAHVVEVLRRLGDAGPMGRFLKFCARAFDPKQPFFRQKYRLDGTPGATWHPLTRAFPFQEDESASVVSLIGSADFVPEFAAPLAEAILDHIDPATDLPRPSYDLWEERYGVHTYTTATVIRALRTAASLFPGRPFGDAAEAMRQGLRIRLFDQSRGAFFRRLDESGHPDPCVDSATLHVVFEGVLDADDPMAIANLAQVEETLWVDSVIGGLARYEDDYYFRRDFNLPGNPWLITTLWLAQAHLAAGRPARTRELLDWATARQAPTGVLPEQVDPHTGDHLSVSPLTWSHAEYLKTTLQLEQAQSQTQ